MLRVTQLGSFRLAFVLALLAGAFAPVGARAQLPINPLRSSAPPGPTARQAAHAEIFDRANESESGWMQPLTHSLVAAEASPPDPPSVVPHALGQSDLVQPELSQPELLPSPAGMRTVGTDVAPFDWPDSDAHEHLVHPWLDEPWFAHSDPNDPHRHIGLGQPLIGTSWRNRPWFFGTFVGGVLMDDLISDRVYQNDTPLVGLRLGFDFDHFWGLEGRWAFANPELTNGAGTPLADPSRDYFADVSLAWFPFGDARWRPYLSAGLGFQTYRFNDDLGQRISESMLSLPLGIGVKYFYGPWCTLRFDLCDNVGFGNARVSSMSNFSLMAGVEFRFGGRRESYFPWHNNTSYW